MMRGTGGYSFVQVGPQDELNGCPYDWSGFSHEPNSLLDLTNFHGLERPPPAGVSALEQGPIKLFAMRLLVLL